MLHLLASAFTGFGMLFSSMFGGHNMPPQTAGTTAPSQNMWGGSGHENGTSTPYHIGANGKEAPSVLGQVVSIIGSNFVLNGRLNMPMTGTSTNATTTYSVDASGAKFIKFGKGMASSTQISIADIAVGDRVLAIGTVTGNSIVATTVVDGLPSRRPLMHHQAGNMMMGGRGMGTSTAIRP